MNEPIVKENLIHKIRGTQVMLDSDLARLYGIPVKVLNQAVKRNSDRFPADFMFQLTLGEARALNTGIFDIEIAENRTVPRLRSQIVTSNRGGRRNQPFVFTEHGVLMLSSVLKSQQAIEMNIAIMRMFVKMRDFISISKLDQKIDNLQKILDLHIDKTELELYQHTNAINDLVDALNKLRELPASAPRRRIGFRTGNDDD
ncbi:MAG: ORF6N domain-containing protein [Rickettsiales bacterium]|nr:ORF6N domain-containing protein [Rickettsiales bacterium]